MNKTVFGATALLLWLTACTGREPAAGDGRETDSTGPGSSALKTLRCGDETFTLALDESRARVTLPDGSSATLERQTTPDQTGASRTYSDGRLTVVQESESRTLFARGRMVPTPCTEGRQP